jgi:hypothetical protein
MSTLRVNTIQNVAGTGTPAIDGVAKAWVNFNGTGTVAIRGSYNVSSITDNGTGNYTVNFTNAMPDTNYAAVTAVQYDQSNSTGTAYLMGLEIAHTTNALQTTSANFWGRYGVDVTLYDMTMLNVAIFR